MRRGIKCLNKSKLRENAAYTILLAPFMLLFAVFTVLPILSSVVLSFFDYDMVSTPLFNGLGNYFRMFMEDKIFTIVLKNTLIMAVVTGPIGFILSFLLAWCISEFNPILRTFLAFMFYAPALVGNAFYIWQVAFSGDANGYLNSILLSLGLINDPIVWFKDMSYNMTIVMIVQLWSNMGVAFLANVAGVQNVSEELFEAGAIDGIRNRWQELWYITLPSMKSILLFGAVMQIQASFSIGPVVTALAGYPSVNNSIDTIVSYLSDVGTLRYEFGYAAAISVFLFVLMAFTKILIENLLDLLGK